MRLPLVVPRRFPWCEDLKISWLRSGGRPSAAVARPAPATSARPASLPLVRPRQPPRLHARSFPSASRPAASPVVTPGTLPPTHRARPVTSLRCLAGSGHLVLAQFRPHRARPTAAPATPSVVSPGIPVGCLARHPRWLHARQPARLSHPVAASRPIPPSIVLAR
ncbi:hypothetical protein Dimus_023354 [Dionaea muscipula]